MYTMLDQTLLFNYGVLGAWVVYLVWKEKTYYNRFIEVLNDIKAQRVATAPAPTEADKAPEWAKALIAGQRDFNERLKALEKR